MINLNQITFGYRAKQTVLEELSLHLEPGYIYGLLGRNGAGKSSLLHTISGLLFPNSGDCRVAGYEPMKRDPKFLQQVYLLPEEVSLPKIKVKDYMEINAPFYPDFSKESFAEMLIELDMSADLKLNNLSMGQRKKVAICFALATRVKVLLMDEPTNGLDIPSKKQFRRIIAGAVQPDQIIIISTHQVRDLDSLIDYVLILDDKKIILNQPIDAITEKLAFKQVMNLNEVPQLIYSEGGLKGYAVVAANTLHEESKFDMEMFFNALQSEKSTILSQFNTIN